jgi:hypothetical protein
MSSGVCGFGFALEWIHAHIPYARYAPGVQLLWIETQREDVPFYTNSRYNHW